MGVTSRDSILQQGLSCNVLLHNIYLVGMSYCATLIGLTMLEERSLLGSFALLQNPPQMQETVIKKAYMRLEISEN